LPLC